MTMTRIGIAVVDASRARLFTVEEHRGPGGKQAEGLVERGTLVDPARRQKPGALFEDTGKGSFRTPTGRGFGASDHREEHLHELEQRFAGEVVIELESMIGEFACDRVIVVASSTMQGPLRQAMTALRKRGVPIEELGKDLTRQPVAALHDHLATHGLVAPRARRGVA